MKIVVTAGPILNRARILVIDLNRETPAFGSHRIEYFNRRALKTNSGSGVGLVGVDQTSRGSPLVGFVKTLRAGGRMGDGLLGRAIAQFTLDTQPIDPDHALSIGDLKLVILSRQSGETQPMPVTVTAILSVPLLAGNLLMVGI